jgi:hypothetical protein
MIRPATPEHRSARGSAAEHETRRFSSCITASSCARWCAYALIMLVPGTLVIITILWLLRRFVLPSR